MLVRVGYCGTHSDYVRVRTLMWCSNWTQIDGAMVTLNLIKVEPDGSKTDFRVGRFFDVKIIR